MQRQFLLWERVIFRCSEEPKYLSGGGVLYAAQSNAQIDEATTEKGRSQAETGYIFSSLAMVTVSPA
jgi:hypothetical protein